MYSRMEDGDHSTAGHEEKIRISNLATSKADAQSAISTTADTARSTS